MKRTPENALVGLALVLVGGAIMVSVAPKQTREVLNALKNNLKKTEEQPQTEDVTFTIIEDAKIVVPEPIIINSPIEQKGMIRKTFEGLKSGFVKFWNWLY
jgi:hypothetical protein